MIAPRTAPARALGVGLLLLLAADAAAQEPPVSITGAYSQYEMETIREAERALGAEVDPAPEGKVVEAVETVRLDPVERRDPAPAALDALHTTTKPDVILHEVLVRPGDRYSKILVDESARNLRLLPQVSLVLCVALRGSSPDRVRLLIITKDVWSLYPDFDLDVTSGGLENLVLEPKETNLGGRQQTLMGRLTLQPASWSLGAEYVAPRFEGRFLTLTADGNVVFDRASGAPEGSYGTASLQRPLFTTRTEWAWSVGMTWQDRVYRRYVDAQVSTFTSPLAPADPIPWVYRSRTIDEQASVTRSFGWARKNDLTVGADASLQAYRVPGASGHDPAAVQDFVTREVPVADTRVGPFVQWHAYATDFVRILDFQTLALQEDYRLGYEVVVRAYPVARALGSSRDFVGVRAAAMVTARVGDGLARAWVDTTTETESTRIADGSIAADAMLVSPRTPAGRLVFDATVLDRYRNYLNQLSTMGGESRIRGYPTNYFVGKDVLAANLELRSRPVELAALQFGASLFYDVGAAFDGFDAMRLGHSVGFGVRAVFPQVERDVLRFDVGFPVAAGGLPAGVAPVSFFVAFRQAFSTTSVAGPFGP